jgi:hypothetical protein
VSKKDPSELVGYWLNEIKQAREREADYRKDGGDILKLYEAHKSQPSPFNILYSNTETLLPALFSAIPRPVIERRFKDDDPVGKLAAQAGKRMLEFLIDTNMEGYQTFGEALEDGTFNALLPGRGEIQVKYDANFKQLAEPEPPDQDDTTPSKAEPVEYAEKEKVCVEAAIWDRVYYGYAKQWHKVPWIAYEFYLTKEEVTALLDEKSATKLKYTTERAKSEDEDSAGRDEKLGQRKTACLYQIWDKAGGKKIRYIAPSYKDDQLAEQDDPLELTGFFNMPRPLQFVKKSWNLVPTAPYQLYKTQAQELNRITKRINKIVEAVKARGAYDGALGEVMKKIFDADDNALVPADTPGALASEKGFQNAIWMIPVDVLVAVLNQLYQAREACKQTIYEITGIADIMRGSTNASETLGAQQIKNQWGTLRLKRMQREVARYARDLMRMMLELAATKFSEETWAGMTNLPFITTAQKQQLDQQAQALAQMIIPGQPPNPQQQQQMQQLQMELQKPVWGQILQILRDDFQRAYRIDIETNSTVEPEAAEDQKAITDLLMAVSQTLQSLSPLVQSGVMPFQAAQSLLLFIARRFRFGSEIEDYIQAMQPPKPPEQDKTQEVEAQKKSALQEVEHAKKQSEMSIKEKAMQAQMDHSKREMDLQLREHQLKIDQDKMAMTHQANQQAMAMQHERQQESLNSKGQLLDMKEKKFNTEAVVHKKTDTAMGQVTKQIQQLQQVVQELAEIVKGQSGQRVAG